MKFRNIILKTLAAASVALVVPIAFAAPPPATATSLTFAPSATVALNGAASAVVTVLTPDSSGLPVSTGTVTLFQAKANGLPGSCEAQNGKADTSTGLTAAPDVNGQVSFDLQAAGLTGTIGTVGYIAKFDDPGKYAKSASPCLDLTIIPDPVLCDSGVNATISAIRTSGVGFPLSGVSNTWTFIMRIHACQNLTNVSAQGGNNAWTGAVLGPPPIGTSVSLRKATGGKNTVNIWTVGSLANGSDIDLPITITGTIKAGTPCGTVVGLLGSWSAKSTSATYGGQDSTYTGTSTVTVGPDPCI